MLAMVVSEVLENDGIIEKHVTQQIHAVDEMKV